MFLAKFCVAFISRRGIWIMSRVGKYPVVMPQGVTCTREGQAVLVKGPQGQLKFPLPSEVLLTQDNQSLTLAPADKTAVARRLWGTTRSLLENVVQGVFQGFKLDLEIEGVGYRASVQGKILKLQLGYSHDIDFPIPEGMKITCEKPTTITVWGVDRQKVGQIAANIQSYRPPEPYKGKGIRRAGQFVFRKEGKKK
jgi:large subunit ribosomal protein L6